jgi:signal peptidase II
VPEVQEGGGAEVAGSAGAARSGPAAGAPGGTPSDGRAGRATRARLILAATVLATVAGDQLSKALAARLLASGRPARIIGTLLDLQLTRNPGGAFGIMPSRPLVFFTATVVIVAAVLAWGIASGRAPAAVGLVAGGGLGNLIDRVVRSPGGFRGHVVDFIHFRYWPTFNLADSSIVIGVGLLMLLELRPRRPGP